MIFTSEPDRLVAFSFDVDSMRRKSITGRGAAALVTGGMSVVASNNRGVIYVTITGERSGTKTYTTRNPEDKILSSIRTLQAAADTLLASPSLALTAPTLADPSSGARERFGDGPYAVLLDLPHGVRQQIADQLKRDRPIGAIKTLRDALGADIGLKEAKHIIDALRQLPDEDRKEILDGLPQLPEEGSATTTQRNNDIATQLKQLADLHAAGALSDEEFAAAKTRLLS